MKLCNNFLSATAMTATSEAMVLGVKAGLDPRVMLDVINSGSGRNTATEDKFGRVVLPRLFNLGFTTGLMTKDVKPAHSVCPWKWHRRSPACCSSPATRSAPRRTSRQWFKRSSAAPALKYARAAKGVRL